MSYKPCLLLVSTACYDGGKFLAHCTKIIRDDNFLGNRVRENSRAVLVPFGLEESEWEGYTEKAREAFQKLGYSLVSLHEPGSENLLLDSDTKVICVGEGNVFRLLKKLEEKKLTKVIVEAITGKGKRYIGIGSSGCTIVNKTIELTCDTPVVELSDLNALGIYNHVVIPNFMFGSLAYGGEKIETVAQQHFNETLNDVIGLPKGGWLLQGYAWIHVGGTEDAIWFNSTEDGTATWKAGVTKWTAFSL